MVGLLVDLRAHFALRVKVWHPSTRAEAPQLAGKLWHPTRRAKLVCAQGVGLSVAPSPGGVNTV